MKYLLTILLLSSLWNYSIAQVTNILDPNFEQVLLDLGIDSDGTLNG